MASSLMMEGERSINMLEVSNCGAHNEEPRIWLLVYRRFLSMHLAKNLEQRVKVTGLRMAFCIITFTSIDY